MLIDEVRAPMIISAERPTEGLAEMAECGLDIARQLAPREHYHLDVAG